MSTPADADTITGTVWRASSLPAEFDTVEFRVPKGAGRRLRLNSTVLLGAPDTRYDDLIARLRDAARNAQYLCEVAADIDDEAWWPPVGRVLRVVADVIA